MVHQDTQPRPAVQLWLPLQSFSIYNEKFKVSLSKSALDWEGEDRIWLLPNIKKTYRWAHDRASYFHEVAIPYKNFNVIVVMHINPDGENFPTNIYGIPHNWTKIPENLYSTVLESQIIKEVLYEPSKFQIEGPFFLGDTYIPRYRYSLSTGPGVKCKVDEVEELLSSEPFTESMGVQLDEFPEGAFDYETSDTINVVFNLSDPALNQLFPLGINPYVINNLRLMEQYKKNNDTNKIKEMANTFCSSTSSTFFKAWLLPKLFHNNSCNPEKANSIVLTELEAELKLNKNYKTVDEVLQDTDLAYELYIKEYPVTRIHTWVGYFWWELNRQVELGIDRIKNCKLCGKVITGRSNKKYCSKEENNECWKIRRARNKRTERSYKD